MTSITAKTCVQTRQLFSEEVYTGTATRARGEALQMGLHQAKQARDGLSGRPAQNLKCHVSPRRAS